MTLTKRKVGVFLMKRRKVTKVAVVRSHDPMEFEKLFNERIDALADSNPTYQIKDTGDILSAVITYEEVYSLVDSIADEFHFEGVRYLCKHCPHLEDPKDRRIKYCKCKYAELGMTHKNHEACEFFYRQLKAGLVDPLEEYER